VDEYLASAELPEIPGEVLAVVSPHAGHRYSGPVAGYAFAAVRERRPDVVVIASPMHQPYHSPVLTTAHAGYRTPLGAVPVHQQALAEITAGLQEEAGLEIEAVSRDQEHSVEIILPFLQRVFRHDFHFVPLMIRSRDAGAMRLLGSVMADVLRDRECLLVASTDLSHFYSAEEAERLDSTIIQHIVDFHPHDLFKAEENQQGFACGKSALAAVMWAARGLGATRAHHLHYAHSGHITGDTTQVVGYTAAAFSRP
jgi:AmmeMemoRadiSam system protein B